MGRAVILGAVWAKDRGLRHVEIGGRDELPASTVANEVAYKAVQTSGEQGYMKDYPVERCNRGAWAAIYEETSELQRPVVSEGIVDDIAARDPPAQGVRVRCIHLI